ncbi:hypothetical protein BV898_02853 [Hypsibius exemplaris]|uniref:Uncharacterized protein n=1 Tax=Hypsibius exemplaris TaxID=2072580 RepID=A0A1W0X6I9_HYPEX|nr:hypothetical protein BV898_02853 [Hypsibius exemplaris]
MPALEDRCPVFPTSAAFAASELSGYRTPRSVRPKIAIASGLKVSGDRCIVWEGSAGMVQPERRPWKNGTTKSTAVKAERWPPKLDQYSFSRRIFTSVIQPFMQDNPIKSVVQLQGLRLEETTRPSGNWRAMQFGAGNSNSLASAVGGGGMDPSQQQQGSSSSSTAADYGMMQQQQPPKLDSKVHGLPNSVGGGLTGQSQLTPEQSLRLQQAQQQQMRLQMLQQHHKLQQQQQQQQQTQQQQQQQPMAQQFRAAAAIRADAAAE